MKILRTILVYLGAVLFTAIGSVGVWITFFDAIRIIRHIEIKMSPFDFPIWVDLGHPNYLFYVRLFEDSGYYSMGGSAVVLLMGIGLFIYALQSAIAATPGAIVQGIVASYKAVIRWRNWLLEKVEYLQGESAKWKTTFNILKSPYSFLRAMGLSPQMAGGLLLASSTVGTGVIASETVFADRSFKNGDSGTYSAPADIPTEYIEGDNTLRIVLGTVPVREIRIENVSVGTIYAGSALPHNQTSTVLVGGLNNRKLEIGELVIEKSRCKSMDFSTITAHTVNVIGNASDGQSINTTPGYGRMRAIGGGHHQAEAMVTSGGTYDRIHIDSPDTNGKIDKLVLSNLYTKGGSCSFSQLDVGTLTILKNEIGEGNGFATKEFSIANTVTGQNWTVEDNVEVSISEPATIQ